MNKLLLFSFFFVFIGGVFLANLYILQERFHDKSYADYREEYIYNLKNPLLEKYRTMAIE